MISISNLSVLVLAACSAVLAAPQHSTQLAARGPSGVNYVIGYRVVTEAEAKAINKRGWLTFEEPGMPDHAKKAGQFGIGKSLSASLGSWDATMYGTGPPWFCYVLADSHAFAMDPQKVWLNEHDYDEKKTQEAIKKINAETAKWDNTKTLRFGMCGVDEELLIPVPMLGTATSAGPLHLEAHCFKTQDALKKAMKAAGYSEGTKVDYSKYRIIGLPSQRLMVRNPKCKFAPGTVQ